jgi:tRNA modification GTPase
MHNTDTIVALATPPGRGGVAVIRISGPLVKTLSEAFFKKKLLPRIATYTSFLDEKEETLDQGIALYFPAPHSFTGEDVLEFQGHGGPIIVDMLIRRILSFGVRLAKPGEFSERAFLNDKMDLAQAEAIADLIDSVSEEATRAAMRSLQGDFSKKISQLVETLIQLRMFVEAAIDFVEEEINFLENAQVTVQLSSIIKALENIEKMAMQGSVLREGISVVIAGEPNVGKSSLLNCLSQKDIAIVTDIPGTTRDLLREHIVMDGIPLHIIDTAGLRESDDPVEKEGMRRARDEITRADMVLHVIDAEKTSALISSLDFPQKKIITVRNKIDLTKEPPSADEKNNTISLSAKTGDGMDLLKQKIKKIIGFQSSSEGLFLARRRHLDAIVRAKDFLLQGVRATGGLPALTAAERSKENRSSELLAEDLRQAQLALSEITGEFTSDDLLGRIFSNFCIGK